MFLTNTAIAATSMMTVLRPGAAVLAQQALAQKAIITPVEVLARDELYWGEIQRAFSLDRTIINLNAGISPSPRVVHEALKQYLDFSNQVPIYNMEQVLEPNVESVRRALAKEFGCDSEELAITRNATEALQAVQLGIDLKPGDEVVSTSQDYWAMWNAWDQRVRRDGIKYIEVPISVPHADNEEIVRKIERAFTSKTKVLLISHITFLTGHIFPVKELCRIARKRGIKTIVDGAHGFAQVPFKIGDLECDYYATSLHKWLMAPVGSGFLYVRRENISSLWSLMPAHWESLNNDIRKFEQSGTHPAANHNSITEALAFHQSIGIELKTARLQYLKNLWSSRFLQHPRVKFYTNLDPVYSCAIATVHIEGTDPEKLAKHLWEQHRILVFPVKYEGYHGIQGIRIVPNIYTTIEEIDIFTQALESLLKNNASVNIRI